MLQAAFLIVAVICFILAAFYDGRLQSAGLAFFAGSFLLTIL